MSNMSSILRHCTIIATLAAGVLLDLKMKTSNSVFASLKLWQDIFYITCPDGDANSVIALLHPRVGEIVGVDAATQC